MKNAIRCCISCILPCGALDVIRIVHANGRVEEISGGRIIRACEVMKAYPKHVLKKPPSSSSCSDSIHSPPRIVILPPDAKLQRGKIYFLMPLPSSSKAAPKSSSDCVKAAAAAAASKPARRRRREVEKKRVNGGGGGDGDCVKSSLLLQAENNSDQYLSEILSESRVSNQRERRRGRVGVWRPHLESICESPACEQF